MSKLYDFRFVLRVAEFKNGSMVVVFGGSNTVYHESCAQMEFKAAQKHLAALSAGEPRSHQASLMMKYRDDRKPAGFDKFRGFHHNADEVAEWVGLHYKVNFDAESISRKGEWVERFKEAHCEIAA